MTQPTGFGQPAQQWVPQQNQATQGWAPAPQWGPPVQQWGPPQAPTPQWPQPAPTQPVGQNPWDNPQPPHKSKKWPWVLAGIVGTLVVVGVLTNQGSNDTVAQSPAATATQEPAATPAPVAKAEPTRKAVVPQSRSTATAAPAAASWAMPNLRGSNLQDAQDAIQRLTGDAIFFTDSHDVSGASRMQILDRDWRVCSQNVSTGTRIDAQSQIDFGVVKTSESCP